MHSLNGDGLNCLLEGVEKSAESIAAKVKELVTKAGVKLPVKTLGMGLAGAENPEFNQRFVEFLQTNYGDLSSNYYLNTDSVVSIAANFSLENGGIVLIAGKFCKDVLLFHEIICRLQALDLLPDCCYLTVLCMVVEAGDI